MCADGQSDRTVSAWMPCKVRSPCGTSSRIQVPRSPPNCSTWPPAAPGAPCGAAVCSSVGTETGTGPADGGTVRVTMLRTGEIHTDGGIPAGTPDLITGAVFVISGAVVDEVLNSGPVITYGPNDMALDNWGQVRTWVATAPVTSHGPSGIGFVNFGDLGRLDIRAPAATHGTGARGFNLYDGSLRCASFDSLATTGDGAVGVQVSRELPRLDIRGDLTTSGGTGASLVRGVQVQLQAIALSIKPGGRIGQVTVGGRIATRGDNLVTLDVTGELDGCQAGGGVQAEGQGSDAVHVHSDGVDLAGSSCGAVTISSSGSSCSSRTVACPA